MLPVQLYQLPRELKDAPPGRALMGAVVDFPQPFHGVAEVPELRSHALASIVFGGRFILLRFPSFPIRYTAMTPRMLRSTT